MRHVTIRSRADGIKELAPRLAPLAPGDRLLVSASALLVTGGFFVCGFVPPAVAAAIAAACVAGDVVLAAKAVVLALLRPAAEVHEVPWAGMRRGR